MEVVIETLINNDQPEASEVWSSLVSERPLEGNASVEDHKLEKRVTITGSADAIMRKLIRLTSHSDPEIKEAADSKLQAFLGEYCELISGDAIPYED